MSDTIHYGPDGRAYGTGLLLPDAFPAEGPKFADAFRPSMLTADEVRARLAPLGGKSLWGRREKWAGRKYISYQRTTSACNGHAVANMTSKARELRGEPYVLLSGADAYSQMNGGRDQGSTLADGVKVCESGIATDATVPWNLIYARQIPAAAREERLRFKGFTTYAVDDEDELATAMLLGRVAVIAVHVANSFYQVDGDGVNRGVNGVGNHSVGSQDIKMLSDGTLCFDMPNSWDITWGDGGHTWLTWKKQLQMTVKYHRFFVVVSTTDDPGDGSTPPVAG